MLVNYSNNFFSGSSFWKVTSRKVFFVNARDHEAFRESFDLANDESNDDAEPPTRRRRIENCSDQIINELKGLKSNVNKIFAVTLKKGFPIGFIDYLEDTFSCCIYTRCPPKPALICCRSCSSLVGCQECVDKWYGSGLAALNKHCPRCREPRGYANTFELKGMSSLLEQMETLMEHNPSQGGENAASN